MVNKMLISPQKVGLLPFQMAVLWLINGADPNYSYDHFQQDTHFLRPSSLGGWHWETCFRLVEAFPPQADDPLARALPLAKVH